ncbi:hypothetical protein BT93_E0897 [Corymbia citriodora subsp. variegata]|nr:hypothetical protein BT93_E0897 [Corymbia citriodora subsp. variegata]
MQIAVDEATRHAEMEAIDDVLGQWQRTDFRLQKLLRSFQHAPFMCIVNHR